MRPIDLTPGSFTTPHTTGILQEQQTFKNKSNHAKYQGPSGLQLK